MYLYVCMYVCMYVYTVNIKYYTYSCIITLLFIISMYNIGIPSEIKERKTALQNRTVQYTGDYSHTHDNTNINNITEATNLVRSPSTIIIQNISRQRFHTSKQLNDYVEALSRKIRNKPPSYLDEDHHFTSIMVSKKLVFMHILYCVYILICVYAYVYVCDILYVYIITYVYTIYIYLC